MRELTKFETFFKDIWIELSQKVTWPSRKQLVDMTVVVLVFIMVWSLYIGALDFAFAKGFEKFLDFAQVRSTVTTPTTIPTPDMPSIPTTPPTP